MATKSTVGENLKSNMGSCSILKFIKIRVVDFLSSQPSSFCFILSLFFIAVTLALLGLYIKGDHMPDIDAMKYWNAYVGKLGDKDFCFQEVADSTEHMISEDIPRNISSLCGSNRGYMEQCSDMDNQDNVLFGVVGVKLNFSVHKQAIEKLPDGLQGFHSSFSGDKVGAQVKEDVNYSRIESCIQIDIWIQLLDINVTAACSDEQCIVPGCLVIAAPMNSIPTRMPHVHKNFTFAAQVLESKGKPEGCNCNSLLSKSMKLTKINIIHDNKICSLVDPAIVKLSHSSKRPAKGYGVINVELSDNDKSKASEHMYIAALSVALLGCAFTIGILLSPAPSTQKKSLA